MNSEAIRWCVLVKVAVIGLGYVGLPLLLALSKFYKIIGFDIDATRIRNLIKGFDNNTQAHFAPSQNIFFTSDSKYLLEAEVFIIAVPTPIYTNKTPDLSHLFKATKIVAKNLKKNDLVIFESTTYPFCTNLQCTKILSDYSKLVAEKDFFVGYSPERINPGDDTHCLENTTKIIAANTPYAKERMRALYEQITDVYIAPSIEVAEMAKLIENAQRDLNIAFINEVAIMCDRLNLSATEVLKAARTKWNFLDFAPGLVGGHCISVDPYYLAFIMKDFSYKPKILSMGRYVNNKMPSFLAKKIRNLSAELGLGSESQVLILGLSFKENCADMRNSKVVDLRKKLKKQGFKVKVFDPLIDRSHAKKLFGFKPLKSLESRKFDIVILVNAHKEFLDLDIRSLVREKHIVFDLKNILSYATHRL